MSNRYSKDWTHLIIKRTTLADLRAFADRLERQYVEGRSRIGEAVDGVSMDLAIRELLRRDKAHFIRMRRSRQRKASGSRNGDRPAGEGVINNGPAEGAQ